MNVLVTVDAKISPIQGTALSSPDVDPSASSAQPDSNEIPANWSPAHWCCNES